MLGMAATFGVYSVCANLVYREATLRFNNDSRDVEQEIATRVRLYSDVLVTMQALFGAHEEVSRGEFRDFVVGLDLSGRYPGFQTLNYAPRVQTEDLAAFVEKQRRDPLLRKAHIAFTLQTEGVARRDYYVLTYVEPLESNVPSLGIDMGTDGPRLAAIERSRDTGNAISSGRRIFVDGGGAQQVGLAMRLPVYRRGMPATTVEERRRAYLGSVGAGIRIDDMMAGLLSAETLRVIHFKIYDAGNGITPALAPSPETLLFDSVSGTRGGLVAAKAHAAAQTHPGAAQTAHMELSHDPQAALGADRLFERTAIQSFGGRRWMIAFTADPIMLSGAQRYLPRIAFVAGAIISELLSILAYALSSSRARAIKLADQMTYDLRESETALAEAQRIAHLGDWRINFYGAPVHLSNEMARLIGWRVKTPTLKALLRTIEPTDRRDLLEHVRKALSSHIPFELECRYRSRRGRLGWLRLIGGAYGSGRERVLRGTALEITKQKSVERVRELEHAFTLWLAMATNEFAVFQQLIGSLTTGMDWEAGAFWPTRAGYEKSLASSTIALASELEPWLASRANTVLEDEDVPVEPHWYFGNSILGLARARWMREAGVMTVFAFALRTGSTVLGIAEFYSRSRRHIEPQALEMARSIVSQMGHFLQRRQAEDNLHFLANHDALTGLPNRLMFKERLEEALARAGHEQASLHVMFIDLDRFKDINDSLGHNVGDQLLRSVADRLRADVLDAEMIARLGGDEFIVLVKRGTDCPNVLQTVEAIQGTLAKPFAVSGIQLQVSASIGISSFPGDGNDAQTLLKHADIAMYGAKQRGKNTYQMYVHQMSMSLQRRVEMETQLRHAVENREFILHYQPRVDLATNCCTGVEALIRWNNPVLGFVMPSDFIPLAEETGMIEQIGAWVLREACRQSAEWLADGIGPLSVAVNLSARQFTDGNLQEHILEALRLAQLPGELLELELTESMVMRQPEQAARWLSSLKQTGVRLSIDDFGTGYSSLAYLNRFPIDVVKIDRSFIRDVPDSRSDAQITSAVIALGHSLGLTVIAEGAETQEQIDFLRNEGCDEVQGYFYSRPIPADDIRAFLGRRTDHGLAEPQRPPTDHAKGSNPRRVYYP
jgi:diguanylate cyclase (GGDEF)-like protein